MAMRRCVIFSAGEYWDVAYLKSLLREDDFCIGADGGYLLSKTLERPLDLWLGDRDSLNEVPDLEERRIFPVQKDDTDTMLAIKEGLRRGFRSFLLLGALGGRFDHSIANIQSLAYLVQHHARGEIADESHRIFLIQNESIQIPQGYGYFSVFAFGKEAKGVTITGGEYDLADGTLTPFFPLGVSNHRVKEPTVVSVREGCLLVILSEREKERK